MSSAFLVAAQEQPFLNLPQNLNLTPIVPIMFCLVNPALIDQSVELINDKMFSVFDGIVRVIRKQESSKRCPLLMMKRMMVVGKGKASALTQSACKKAQSIQAKVLSAVSNYFWCVSSDNATLTGCNHWKNEKERIAKSANREIQRHLTKHRINKDVSKWIGGATERVYQMFSNMRDCILKTTTDMESMEFADKVFVLDENGEEVEHREKTKFLAAVQSVEPFRALMNSGKLQHIVVE